MPFASTLDGLTKSKIVLFTVQISRVTGVPEISKAKEKNIISRYIFIFILTIRSSYVNYLELPDFVCANAILMVKDSGLTRFTCPM